MAIRDIYSEDRYSEDRTYRNPAPHRGNRDMERGTVPAPGLLEILWRRKMTILASVVLCLGAGLAYLAVAKPLYLASTAILIDPRLGKTVGSDPNTPGFIADTAAIDSQIKLLTSQTVLGRVAAMAHLSEDRYFNGSRRSLLERLLHPKEKTEVTVLRQLDKAITIKRPERTYVVEIDVLAHSPEKAAEIANDIPKAYVADQVQSRVGAAKDDTGYVTGKLEKLSAQIRDLDDQIETYKTKHHIVDTSGLRSNEQQVAELTKALSEAQARTSDAQAKLAAVEQLSKSNHLDAAGDALHSVTIERLRQQQGETQQNVARLRMTLGPRHPELVEAVAREEKVERLIHEELQRQKLAATSDVQSAKRNEKQILAGVASVKDQSVAMSRALIPLDKLERDRRVLSSSFDHFSQLADTIAQQEGDTPPGRVLAIAEPPVSPASPRKGLVAIISLGAGVFLGMATALFAEGTSPLERPLVPSPGYDLAPRAVGRDRDTPVPLGRPRRSYWDEEDDYRS